MHLHETVEFAHQLVHPKDVDRGDVTLRIDVFRVESQCAVKEIKRLAISVQWGERGVLHQPSRAAPSSRLSLPWRSPYSPSPWHARHRPNVARRITRWASVSGRLGFMRLAGVSRQYIGPLAYSMRHSDSRHRCGAGARPPSSATISGCSASTRRRCEVPSVCS